MIVKAELEKLGLHPILVELGEVEVTEAIGKRKYKQLNTALQYWGLELIEGKKAMQIERIKNVVIEMVHYSDELPATKFSNYLSRALNCDYGYLSLIFSQVKGITIEHFVILHKIERVKELIIYGELSLAEIAHKMHYSSAAHLSKQFKATTGLTPSFFKTLKNYRRKPLDEIGNHNPALFF
jgi:AraC-like DNA-binding protein